MLSIGRNRRIAALALALAGGATLTSCMSATPYQPASARGAYGNGYTDEQLEADRFRVSFAGNSLTSRDTVERYLLYRAAQLTVERGFDHFTLINRDTEKHTRTYVDPAPFSSAFRGGLWGGWGPSWRYYGRGFGWRHWDPFWGDPFWDRDVDVRTVDRYEAIAEIVLGKGPKPADVHAFDARSVLENLGPSVMPPPPAG